MTWERRILALLSSLFVPGSGHVLLGRWRRGAVWMAVVLVALGVAPLLGVVPAGIAAAGWLGALVDTLLVRGAPAQGDDKPDLLGVLAGWGVMFAAGAGAVVTMQAFVGRVYTLEAAAMAPVMAPGDVIVVDRLSSFRHPARGDVVVFRDPQDRSKQLARRVVGLPGDKIAVQGATLYVNDAAVAQRVIDEGYTWREDAAHGGILVEETLDGHAYRVVHDRVSTVRDFPGPEDENPYLVPEGKVFVLGDDRENSRDSRFSGPIPLEDVRGRARWVLWNSHDRGRIGAGVR